jgi:hypothetical protein
MTTSEIIAYYVNLLIMQYKGKPRAEAHIETLVEPVVRNQLFLQIQNAFDIDTAIGAQLDVLGKYAGVQRASYTFTGQVILTDDEFRLLIRLAIVKNTTFSSLAVIQDLLDFYFQGLIRVYDYANMRMSYMISSQIASQNLAQVFVAQNLLPVPMGVNEGATMYAPDLDIFFGFSTYEYDPALLNNVPFNTYEEFNENWYFLNYEYGIGSPSNFNDSLITESGDRIVQEDGSLIFI